MDTSSLDYDLPPELVAQVPSSRVTRRGCSSIDGRPGRSSIGPSASFPTCSATSSSSSTTRGSCRPGFGSGARRAVRSRCCSSSRSTTTGRGRRSFDRRAVCASARSSARCACASRSATVAGWSPFDGDARRGDAAAAVHPRAARRPGPVPDRLRRGRGLGGGADRRAPLHARAPRRARSGSRDAARRARHVPSGRGGRRSRSTSCTASVTRSSPARGSGSRRRARARGRDDDGARARDGRAIGRARGADDALRHAGLRVSPGRRAADELPSAALDPARARHGVRGESRTARERVYRRGDRRALPLLLVRRRDAGPCST